MVVTDPALDPDLRAARAAARAGAWLQARDKGASVGELILLAAGLRGCATALSVNGSLDAALAAAADGLHLPEDGPPAAAARRLAPRGFLIGRSVHHVRAARSATEADYLVFGPVFQTRCKPGAPAAGLAALRAAVRASPIPVLAVGGMGPQRAAAAVAAGAAGIAVRSDVLGSPDPARRVACIYASMAATWRRKPAASRSCWPSGA